MWYPFQSNTALVARCRAKRDALIDDTRAALGPSPHAHASEILSSNIEDIVRGIKEQRWTSTVVAQVFIRQAIVAHDETNCLTEVNFAAALRRAAELDDEFNRTKQLVGPLHGIPFSIKDQFHLKGKQSATGYTEWFKRPVTTEDSALVRIAQHLGAVCIAKTNVPQTMLNFECRNPAWGQTSNPYSRHHTPGGSSGGEAALLAVGGSAFGFGSDVGGSLRIPTSYCGIYALKPSNGRGFPRQGTALFGPAPGAVNWVAGPMCRSLADLALLLRLFTDTVHPPSLTESPRDVQRRFGVELMPYMPLRDAWLDPKQQHKSTLRIGYYSSDGLSQTTPVGLRAMRIAIDALQQAYPKGGADKAQVELVEIPPSKLDTYATFQSFVGLTSITAYDHLRRHLGPDRIDRTLYLALLLPRMPILRFFVRLVIRFFMRDPYVSQLLTNTNGKSAERYFAYEKQKEAVTNAFEKRVWNEMKLDAIIAPVQASPALPHYGSTLLAPLAASTILYNVVGSAVTVVPVTRVDAEKDSLVAGASNQREQRLWRQQNGIKTCSTMIASNLKKQYDSEKQAGLPIGVQVITREHDDEKSVGIAMLLEEALAAADKQHRISFGPGAWDRFRSV